MAITVIRVGVVWGTTPSGPQAWSSAGAERRSGLSEEFLTDTSPKEAICLGSALGHQVPINPVDAAGATRRDAHWADPINARPAAEDDDAANRSASCGQPAHVSARATRSGSRKEG